VRLWADRNKQRTFANSISGKVSGQAEAVEEFIVELENARKKTAMFTDIKEETLKRLEKSTPRRPVAFHAALNSGGPH